MTNEIEIPDNEDAACDLGDVEIMLARKGLYDTAAMVSGAARRLRADAEEIARLEKRIKVLLEEVEARREHRRPPSEPDPLTRIAAALERPSREWVAMHLYSRWVTDATSKANYSQCARYACAAADELLAEMGEG